MLASRGFVSLGKLPKYLPIQRIMIIKSKQGDGRVQLRVLLKIKLLFGG